MEANVSGVFKLERDSSLELPERSRTLLKTRVWPSETHFGLSSLRTLIHTFIVLNHYSVAICIAVIGNR